MNAAAVPTQEQRMEKSSAKFETYNYSIPLEDRLVNPDDAAEVICGICCTILADPMQCKAGHLFCAECITKALHYNSQCPTCRSRLTHDALSRSLFAKNYINELQVHCKNHYKQPNDDVKPHQEAEIVPDPMEGCPKQMKYSQIEKHERECEYSWIRCMYTYGLAHDQQHLFHMVRKNLWQHHKSQCDLRPSICQFCDASVLFITLQEHEDNCEKRPITCDKCNGTLLFGELETHKQQTCPTSVILCPFAPQGCPDSFPRGILGDHMNEKNREHLLYMHTSYTSLIEKLQADFTQAIAIKNKEISSLEEKIKANVYSITIPNFSKAIATTRSIASAKFTIAGYQWYFAVNPYGSNVQKGDFVSMYLFTAETLPPNFNVVLDFTFILLNKNPKFNVKKKFLKVRFPIGKAADGSNLGWGDNTVISTAQLSSGYIVNDTLTVDLYVRVIKKLWKL